MKQIFFILMFLLTISVYSQDCAPNGITTNPAAPINAQNPTKKNNFDFTTPQYNLNWIYNFNNTTKINSPFFDTDNSGINHFYDPLDGIKDIIPSEGWELLKKDFGYADNGAPNNPATANPYIIFYNKYRGLLRVFVARGDQKAVNGANIQVKFLELSPMQTSLLDLSGQLQAINAPFSKNNGLTSVTKFFDLPLKWFYADFPMVYDPCTCLFESKVEIIVTVSSTSILTASGTISGDIVSQGAPTAAQQGKSSFSIGDLNASGKKITEGFKTGQAFKESVDKAIEGLAKANTLEQEKKNAVGQLLTNLQNNGFLKNGLASLPFIGAAVSVLDLFNAGGKTNSGPVEIAPMAINMTQKLSGTIKTDIPYNSITFRTPGSKYTGYPNSEYPYYNEVLGVFNLLRTPVLKKRATCQTVEPLQQYIYSETYRLTDAIQYVINPAANVTVQEIKAAYLIYSDQPGGDFYEYESKDEVSGKEIYRTAYFNAKCLTSLDLVYRREDIRCFGSGGIKGIKFLINLKRNDAGPNTQNILLVLTYPLSTNTVTSLPTPPTCSGTLLEPMSKTVVNSFCNSSEYLFSGRFSRNYNQAANDLKDEEEKAEKERKSADLVLNVSPNPTKGMISTDVNIGKTGNAKLLLLNSFGQQIKVLLDKNLLNGDHRMSFNLGKQPSGIYFVRLITNDGSVAKKIILTK